MHEIRLIDANAVLQKLQSEIERTSRQSYYSTGIYDGLGFAGALIETEPTVDAVPVKHGKWSEYSRNGLETYIERTNCCVASRPIHLQMVTGNGSGLPDYCPNCGAKMGGNKDE